MGFDVRFLGALCLPRDDLAHIQRELMFSIFPEEDSPALLAANNLAAALHAMRCLRRDFHVAAGADFVA